MNCHEVNLLIILFSKNKHFAYIIISQKHWKNYRGKSDYLKTQLRGKLGSWITENVLELWLIEHISV